MPTNTFITSDGVRLYWKYIDGDTKCCAIRLVANLMVSKDTTDFEGETYRNRGNAPTQAQLEELFPIVLKAIHVYKQKIVTQFVGPVDFDAKEAAFRGKADSCIVTYALVDWLIRNKLGTVYTSPVWANGNYGTDPASLNQVWLWYPQILFDEGRVLPGTNMTHNEPDHAEMMKKFSDEVNLYSDDFNDQFTSKNTLHIQHYTRQREEWQELRSTRRERIRSLPWISMG